MPMHDWLHKYPGVAALLQTDADEVLGTSVEAAVSTCLAPPMVSPLTEREAWYAAVLDWAHACLRRYNAQGLYLCVAPDIYADLWVQARPAWETGPLCVHAPSPAAQMHLRLFGRIKILPWRDCAPGTWLAHWSDDASHPRVQALTHGYVSWWHALPYAWSPDDSPETWPDFATLCQVTRPALVCPCGGFLLHWG
jgi:hypothetical protein